MFMQDKTFFFGLVKNIEIIGEATYKLTKDFKDTHTELPWAYMEKCDTYLYTDIILSKKNLYGKPLKVICLQYLLLLKNISAN